MKRYSKWSTSFLWVDGQTLGLNDPNDKSDVTRKPAGNIPRSLSQFSGQFFDLN